MTDFETALQQAAPQQGRWTARLVREQSEQLTVRQDVSEPPRSRFDEGAMVTVHHGRGVAHAATGDLSPSGLAAAFAQARSLAEATAAHAVFDFAGQPVARASGSYRSPNEKPVDRLSLAERFDLLRRACASADLGSSIADRSASLWTTHTEQLLVNSDGARIEQSADLVVPSIVVTASAGGDSITRTSAGQYNGFCQQGGLEVLDRAGFAEDGPRVAREALELLAAPNCPSGEMDVLLMPDQMMLQIHESIGHPLELDRILGDERNFAGTSFVTPDMFGSYAYGSALLNVSYAPDVPAQFASFAFDDDGEAAERQWIIKDGILLRPLGGALSRARAQALGLPLAGVATSRANGWNRAPIDRMSNLNIEPGQSTLDQMIASIDHGILMRTNASWSIDDSRNKFQFGCEYGQMIRNGRLAEVVKRPGYRGISSTFWRSLAMVGNASTWQVMGTPYCGKGEPNQVIRVGHAAPACKFSRVAVFGGGV